MRIVLLKEVPEDENLRGQWNVLVEQGEQPQIFHTYEWALAVQRAYHATLRPFLFLAYDEREVLCGVAALAADLAGKEISFLCATTGDYCDFVSPAEMRPEFVRAVFAELKQQGVQSMAFANLPADSASVPAIQQAAQEQSLFSFSRTGYVCAQVSLGSRERRAEEKPVLPRKKMLRRFLNAMGRESPVRLDHAQSWDAAGPILRQFMQAHVARFLFTGRISNMARGERRTFLAELAKLLSDSGWLALTRMMSGDKAFAWNYGFKFHGTWFWYQPTFDSDLEKYSPGFCLLAKLIEESSNDLSLDMVDLGLGAEEYKDRFANASRKTLYLTVKSSRGQHLREVARYRAAAVAKTSPKIEAAMRAVSARVQLVKNRFQQDGVASGFSWIGKTLRGRLLSGTEVFFYEWNGSARSDTAEAQLHPLDLDRLAEAVVQYVDDQQTLSYLLRSAERLKAGTAQGFVLVDATGQILHLAWSTSFEGFFLSELGAKVHAPSSDAVMLFDCWTPLAVRGRGHYAQAIELAAGQIKAQGKQPWIFSAAANTSSTRGLDKAGFRRRYSIVSKRIFGWRKIKGQSPLLSSAPAAEVSARV